MGLQAVSRRITKACRRCAGNGEVVTDWDVYLYPPEGAPAEAGVKECPHCGGLGAVWDDTDYEGTARALASSEDAPVTQLSREAGRSEASRRPKAHRPQDR